MSTPFVGEIRMFGGNYAPEGWALCQGQSLPIVDNEVLYAVIGTTYGGDGVTVFALPDLRSRVPVHAGTLRGGGSYVAGQKAGEETVTLTAGNLPQHSHAAQGTSDAGTASDPTGGYWASNAEVKQYVAASAARGAMNAGAVGNTGGGQPHDNMLPYVVLNFIIAQIGAWALQGVEEGVAAGYINGFPNGTLQPLGTTTRAQAAKVLALVLGRSGS